LNYDPQKKIGPVFRKTWSSIERQEIAGHLLIHHQWYQVEILDVGELFVYHSAAMFPDEVVE
jgi:hypothetical protein